MVTIKEIRETFRETRRMLTKHKKAVLDEISRHQALLKERLDQQYECLILKKAPVSPKNI